MTGYTPYWFDLVLSLHLLSRKKRVNRKLVEKNVLFKRQFISTLKYIPYAFVYSLLDFANHDVIIVWEKLFEASFSTRNGCFHSQRSIVIMYISVLWGKGFDWNL